MQNSIQKNVIYYKAIVSYQGTYFYGWQSQKKQSTIQDSIEKTLYKLFNFKQRIIGASRTDAGVHAYGQCFTFHAPNAIPIKKLLELINNCLPDTIQIINIEIINNNFHPRFDAKKKIYQYLISKKKLSPAINFFILHYHKEFDINILREATNIFIGKNDFQAFSSAEKDQNTIRIIYDIKIEYIKNIYIITIIGNSFLRYMIRKLLGAALHAATGKITINQLQSFLEKKNKKNNIVMLPAKGLLLKNIIYNDDEEINFNNPFLEIFNFF